MLLRKSLNVQRMLVMYDSVCLNKDNKFFLTSHSNVRSGAPVTCRCLGTSTCVRDLLVFISAPAPAAVNVIVRRQ